MTDGEEIVAGPVGREMKPEATDTAHDATGDFEQVETDRPDRRRRQARAGEDRAAEIGEQQEREAMELQPAGVRAEAMTAEAIRVDIELELFDPILGRPAVVVPRDEIGGSPASRLSPCAVTSILTRMRRACGHVFARCRKLVRM